VHRHLNFEENLDLLAENYLEEKHKEADMEEENPREVLEKITSQIHNQMCVGLQKDKKISLNLQMSVFT